MRPPSIWRRLLRLPALVLALFVLPLAWLYRWRKRRRLRSVPDPENLVAVVFDAHPLPGVSLRDHLEAELPMWVERGVAHIWRDLGRLPWDFALVSSPELLAALSIDPSFVEPRSNVDVLPRGSYLGRPLYVDSTVTPNTLRYVGAGRCLGTFHAVNW